MLYRPFGKTGLEVSALGFGAMRLPEDFDEAAAVITRAFDQGVNFLDSARGYPNSEAKCGKALKGRREQIIVSTKVPSWIEPVVEGWRERFEESLTAFDTGYIDVLQILHDLKWEVFEKHVAPKGKVLDLVTQARDEGLVRYFSFSSHDTPENVIKLIDTGVFDAMIVQYNLLDLQYADAIDHACEKGMGVVAMGPVGGGRLAGLSPELAKIALSPSASTPALALRFVLSNPAISTAISGMNTAQMVDENVATASREDMLSAEERAQVRAALEEAERIAKLYCTGCRYCMPCPHGVDIPGNFGLMNYHRVYGLTEYAKQHYGHKPNERAADDERCRLNASACIECGECEPKCPQHIPIIEQLKETHAALG